MADRFYSSPSKGLNLIGITGTNGKTTVTHLIQKIFEENNEKCALIGTLGYKLSSNGEYRDAKHTTPQAPELQATLRMIKDVEKIDNVVIELVVAGLMVLYSQILLKTTWITILQWKIILKLKLYFLKDLQRVILPL